MKATADTAAGMELLDDVSAASGYGAASLAGTGTGPPIRWPAAGDADGVLADTSPAHSALKAAATRSSRPAPAAVHRGDPILMAASVSASARSWRPERVSPRARSGQERGM